jgi:hypothetical protein
LLIFTCYEETLKKEKSLPSTATVRSFDVLSNHFSFFPSLFTMLLSFTRSNHHRNRGYALAERDRLSDAVFKRMFHVDRPMSDEILDLISPIMIQ